MSQPTLRVRTYGTTGPTVLLLHGGPGAPGYMAPVARGLADAFRVIEPFQRAGGGDPLTVSRHVADLHELIASLGAGARPALVGHSWGAMLALACAAEHPEAAGPIVLVGCGTFDLESRRVFKETVDARMAERDVKRRMDRLAEDYPDPDERLREMGRLFHLVDSLDIIDETDDAEPVDARANRETWEDMLRLQAHGVYPAAFARIRSPVLMLHGAYDPHPGRMIRDCLAAHVPGIEYREWERCGHYPWLERAARDEFFAVLREWLARHAR